MQEALEIEKEVKEPAEFRERTQCVACESTRLKVLDRGTFGDEPHRTLILESPWGTSPFPHLRNCEWVFVECEDCHQIFHQRTLTEQWDERRFREWMTDDAIARFEEAAGMRSVRTKFNNARADVEHLLKLDSLTHELRNGEPMRILDFGCGWGRFIGIAQLFGCQAAGIDRHSARRAGTQSETRIYEGIEEFIASGESPVHVVTLFQVLEHLFSPLAILKALHEQMVPGGILILEVPDAGGISKIRTPDDLVADGIDHINAFSSKTLQGIARRAGFAPINPGVAHVHTELPRVIKREVRRIVDTMRQPKTDQYFRRV